MNFPQKNCVMTRGFKKYLNSTKLPNVLILLQKRLKYFSDLKELWF